MSERHAPSTLLQAVAEVAQLAANVAMRWYRQPVDVEIKGDGSPVTMADRAAEHAARDWIRAHFPHDGIQGEEFADEGAGARRRWLIDPIDGTKSFVRGVPLWGTLIACCEGDTVLAGAACFPAVNELVAAAVGEGCWWNGGRASVSTVSTLANATALITDDRFSERRQRGEQWRTLASQVGVARTWGDCYGYLLVATGRAEIMVDDVVNAWDVAAIQPIISEAGGVFTSWSGASTAFGGSGIATNASLAVATRNILRDERVP